MGDNIQAVKRQERWMRILALAAFFNFSGLNNGFTFFVISSGNVQRFDFTPRLLQSAASVVNPLNWKEKFLTVLKSKFLRSRKVVVFASRNAIKNLLAESALIQTWMAGSLIKNLRNIPGSEQWSAKELKTYGSEVQLILAIGEEFHASAARSFIRTEATPRWLLERHRLLNGRRDVGINSQGPPGLRHPAVIFDAFFLNLGNRAGFVLGFMPENLKSWFSSCLSRGGGDAPAASVTSMWDLRITLHLSLQGDFLFEGAL